MHPRQAVVVACDAISPLGFTLEEQWQRAQAGQSGIGPLTRFGFPADFPVQIAGQVAEFDSTPYPFLRPREMAQWKSPIFRHALLVVHRALQSRGIHITPELAPRTAITFSSAIGGLDAVLQADRQLQQHGKLPPPFTNPNACINMVGGKISILTGATGPITATISACATGLTSMIAGALLLAQNKADVVICGAVDFALVEPIVAGFATMNGTYRPPAGAAPEAPESASRPFSRHRRGFVVSEGAAAIILMAREVAIAHGLTPQLVMAGSAMTSDAHHFVAPYLPTVTRCIQESLQDAGIPPAQVAAVNAHAASTPVGDKVEYDALQAVFGRHLPPVSANKSMLGHAMGASSGIEAILALEGMRRNLLLPTINYQPDAAMPLDCVADGVRKLSQEFVLKNAFGFGGCNACVVFQRE